jgi:membrane protein
MGKEVIKRAIAEFRADDMMTWAAALTYYAVLSLFPTLIVFVALLGVFGEYPQTSDAVFDIIRDLGPASAVDTLRGTVEGVVKSAGALLGLGLLTAIWSASGYISAFFKAANTIYDVQEGRPFLRLKPLQLGLTIVFLIVAALGAIALVLSGSVAKSIFGVVGLGSTAQDVWGYARFPVLAVVVTGMIALLYWAAPNVQQPKLRWLTPGGAVGLLALLIASGLFGVYVANFGSYNKTFGTLAFVPLFLTWLWIANLALLFGAEIDAELARGKQIEAGMRPVDKEPFLPVREEPDPPRTGRSSLARRQPR